MLTVGYHLQPRDKLYHHPESKTLKIEAQFHLFIYYVMLRIGWVDFIWFIVHKIIYCLSSMHIVVVIVIRAWRGTTVIFVVEIIKFFFIFSLKNTLRITEETHVLVFFGLPIGFFFVDFGRPFPRFVVLGVFAVAVLAAAGCVTTIGDSVPDGVDVLIPRDDGGVGVENSRFSLIFNEGFLNLGMTVCLKCIKMNL